MQPYRHHQTRSLSGPSPRPGPSHSAGRSLEQVGQSHDAGPAGWRAELPPLVTANMREADHVHRGTAEQRRDRRSRRPFPAPGWARRANGGRPPRRPKACRPPARLRPPYRGQTGLSFALSPMLPAGVSHLQSPQRARPGCFDNISTVLAVLQLLFSPGAAASSSAPRPASLVLPASLPHPRRCQPPPSASARLITGPAASSPSRTTQHPPRIAHDARCRPVTQDRGRSSSAISVST